MKALHLYPNRTSYNKSVQPITVMLHFPSSTRLFPDIALKLTILSCFGAVLYRV